LYYRILQQSGILARCILFCCFPPYLYVCMFFFFATTSLVNKKLYIQLLMKLTMVIVASDPRLMFALIVLHCV